MEKTEAKKSRRRTNIRKNIQMRWQLFALAVAIGGAIAIPYAGLALRALAHGNIMQMTTWSGVALVFLTGLPITLFLTMRKE